MTTVNQSQVRQALAQIKDPELGLDLVTLGLVYDIRIAAGAVSIRCTLTTPGCPLIETIIDDVKRTVGAIPGVRQVEVDLTFDPPWTPERMSEEARELLGLTTQTAPRPTG